MNFLAHLYLSGSHPDVMIGNFIGDFVKGRPQPTRFTTLQITGIELHRAIDNYTDSHTVVAVSRKKLWLKYRHYAGVIVDMYYDHYLAANWQHYHTKFLPDFAEHCYSILELNKKKLPEQVQHLLPYMVTENWLVNYAKIDGIARALSGMARRTKFDSKLEQAAIDLKQNYSSFNSDFNEFFPELITYCKKWREAHIPIT